MKVHCQSSAYRHDGKLRRGGWTTVWLALEDNALTCYSTGSQQFSRILFPPIAFKNVTALELTLPKNLDPPPMATGFTLESSTVGVISFAFTDRKVWTLWQTALKKHKMTSLLLILAQKHPFTPSSPPMDSSERSVSELTSRQHTPLMMTPIHNSTQQEDFAGEEMIPINLPPQTGGGTDSTLSNVSIVTTGSLDVRPDLAKIAITAHDLNETIAQRNDELTSLKNKSLLIDQDISVVREKIANQREIIAKLKADHEAL
eukprot:PhF_6_TR41341/c0_g1_i1/m.62719